MKKLFAIISLFALALMFTPQTSHAQDIGKDAQLTMKDTWGQYFPTGNTSIAATTATTYYLYTGPVLGFKDVVTIQVAALKTSGTMTGTVIVQVSNDGVSWENYTTGKDTTGGKTNTTTFTLTDNTTAQSYRWNFYNWGDKFARVAVTTTASSVSTFTAGYSAYVKKTNQ